MSAVRPFAGQIGPAGGISPGGPPSHPTETACRGRLPCGDHPAGVSVLAAFSSTDGTRASPPSGGGSRVIRVSRWSGDPMGAWPGGTGRRTVDLGLHRDVPSHNDTPLFGGS